MASNMALNRKYAALPDLVCLTPRKDSGDVPVPYADGPPKDNAPDIYETPDLTDDASTVPVSPCSAPFRFRFNSSALPSDYHRPAPIRP